MSIWDEIVYDIVINSLKNEEMEEFYQFEETLHKREPWKAEALRMFILKIVDLEDVGLKRTQIFLRALLNKKGGDFEETFQKRVTFLEDKNVFSLSLYSNYSNTNT